MRLMTLVLVASLTAFAGLSVAALGCKKKAPAVATTPTTEPQPDARNTNYVPGAGAISNTMQAGRRVVTQAEFQTLGTYIFNEHLNTNKMPSADTIKQILAKDAPRILEAINSGAIKICWTDQYEGIWAYEVGAETQGGIALVGAVANRYRADEIQAMLKR